MPRTAVNAASSVAFRPAEGSAQGVVGIRFNLSPGARCEQRGAALETFLRPIFGAVVILRYGRRARRKDHPRLLRRGEDVNVGRQPIGLVERSDAYEMNRVNTNARLYSASSQG